MEVSNAPAASRRWAIGLVIVLAALLVCAVLLIAWRVCNPKQPGNVTVDDEKVERLLGGGKIESVRWADLQEVWVVTTDEGPAVDDCFIALVGWRGLCRLEPCGPEDGPY